MGCLNSQVKAEWDMCKMQYHWYSPSHWALGLEQIEESNSYYLG